ncbi:MAG: response regulator [Chloroflexi bacterium]|nr:response regulator [Chloroflexota bacterium]
MDASHSGKTGSAADLASWVVLAVDDEADNLTLVTKVLTFKGAQVHTASNGKEGLEMLKSLQPSLILLDLSMPVMDGWEMFELLRANPTLQRVPIIALTAHAMIGDKERILGTGFDGYISKPFRLNTFLTEIMRCLEYQRHQQAK